MTKSSIATRMLPVVVVAADLGLSLVLRPVSLNGINPALCGYGYGYGTVPAIDAVSPNSGTTAGGTHVTLTGCGFTGTTSVHFGATAGTSVVVVSDTSITVTSPAHAAGTVDVTVTTALGTSPTQAGDNFTYQGTTCTTINYTADKASPQQSGTIIRFTASSPACTAPEFKFYVQLADGTWTLGQDYDGASFVWNTAGLPAGTYHIDVWVRQMGSSAPFEAFVNNPYTLITFVPCAGAALTPDKASPQPVGTVVTYTASATGCSQPVYTWYFQVPGGNWYIAKNPSPDPTLTWNTTGAAPGTYKIDVWISQNGSTTPHETFILINYTLVVPPPCATAGYSADKATPQQTGTIVTFTATSTGCPNPDYKWYVQLANGTWTLAQGYSSSTTFVWNTAGLPVGTYHVDLWARQHGDSTDPEAFSNNTYTLIVAVPCSGATLTPDKSSPQPAGTVVTYTAGATGCSQPVSTWYFQVPGGNWYIAKNPSTDPTLVWNTTGAAPGTYKIDVWISQNGSTTPHETFILINYTIS